MKTIENEAELRKLIRIYLEEGLHKELENKPHVNDLSPEKMEHVESNLKSFSDRMKKLAIENCNPYIKSYLKLAILGFENDLIKGHFQMLGADEFML